MYECHITIEPVLQGFALDQLVEGADRYKFKVAKLLMVTDDGIEVPSTRDSFMTGHGENFTGMRLRMISLVEWLRNSGYTVQRYKIESIIIDSKYQDDPEHLLKGGSHASSY